MVVEIPTVVKKLIQLDVPVACVDTCAWLDLFRGRMPAKNAREAIKMLRDRNKQDFVLAVPEQVKDEFIRNKELAQHEYEKCLSAVANGFNDKREDFEDIYSRKFLELRGDFVTHVLNSYVHKVEDLLMNDSLIYGLTERLHAKASMRSCARKAPSADAGKSVADCVIVESFFYLVDLLRTSGYKRNAYFITSNKRDFSDVGDPEKIHKDLELEFIKYGIEYVTSLQEFVHRPKF